MEQELVRIRLLKYIYEKGVTYNHICLQIELPNSIMTLFKNGKKDLYTEHLNRLDDFLMKENY